MPQLLPNTADFREHIPFSGEIIDFHCLIRARAHTIKMHPTETTMTMNRVVRPYIIIRLAATLIHRPTIQGVHVTRWLCTIIYDNMHNNIMYYDQG